MPARAARRPTPLSRHREQVERPPRLPIRPAGAPFLADMDIAELDDRRRPGAIWLGRGHELSRPHLSFRSRRMCYDGRSLIVIVHLVDDRPVSLYGTVRDCEYDTDGLYRTLIELAPIPDEPGLVLWLRERDARGILFPSAS